MANQALQLAAPVRGGLGIGVEGKALHAGTARTGERGHLALGTKTGAEAPDLRGTGTDTTHWRVGAQGMTCSTRGAAVCAMRRPVQEGQKPRHLQLPAFSANNPPLHVPRKGPQNP